MEYPQSLFRLLVVIIVVFNDFVNDYGFSFCSCSVCYSSFDGSSIVGTFRREQQRRGGMISFQPLVGVFVKIVLSRGFIIPNSCCRSYSLLSLCRSWNIFAKLGRKKRTILVPKIFVGLFQKVQAIRTIPQDNILQSIRCQQDLFGTTSIFLEGMILSPAIAVLLFLLHRLSHQGFQQQSGGRGYQIQGRSVDSCHIGFYFVQEIFDLGGFEDRGQCYWIVVGESVRREIGSSIAVARNSSSFPSRFLLIYAIAFIL
mmetsp:Transcript_20558/g.51123  ORF Transcript_20558/g.51123 Transcript_20558/m.51123 type:complete len:257 (-) Transcript_20558:73-843(-)